MTRTNLVDSHTAAGKTKELLENMFQKEKFIPNYIKVLANSEAALAGYLCLRKKLDDSNFSPILKYKLGLLISEEIGSIYCVSKFAQDARNAGLTEKEIARARLSKSDDPKEQALLTFTSLLISRQGDLRKDEVQAVRYYGWTDAELVEACGQIALNYLAGLVVKFSKPELDYPLMRINDEYRTLRKTEPLFTIY